MRFSELEIDKKILENIESLGYNTLTEVQEKTINCVLNNCDAIVMFDSGILDIDSEEDYELMQVIARYVFEKMDGYKEVFEQINNWKQK